MRNILQTQGSNGEESVVFGQATVKCAQISNLSLEAKVRTHTVMMDEPKRSGLIESQNILVVH
jgi:hypothetical protein